MTEPGWYGEPGNAALERYWDGTQWTPQTRPVAPEPPATPPVPTQQVKCMVATCYEPKFLDEPYCLIHGPSRRTQASSPPVARGDAAIMCPHCQTRGRVHSSVVKQKKGISGGKATAAVFTAGFSMLGTGLSRKERVTELRCGNCGTMWHV